jgi:hypothetical protein
MKPHGTRRENHHLVVRKLQDEEPVIRVVVRDK